MSRDLARVCEALARHLVVAADSSDIAAIEGRLNDLKILHPKLRSLRRDIGILLAEKAHPGPSANERADVRRALGAINLVLRRWGAVIACVRQQISRRRVPLYSGQLTREAMIDAQLAASDEVFLLLHQIANPAGQHDTARAHGCFPDIRMRPSEFLGHVHAAYRVAIARGGRRPARFLDVGCGGGVKVLLAARYFDEAHGLEFDPSYAAAAGTLFAAAKSGSCRVLEGDALTFESYGDYDVVYFFQPMSDAGKLAAMEERIVRCVRPGTILIAPYQGFLRRSDDLGCPRVAGSVHLAGVSEDRADDMRARAQRVGPALPHRSTTETALGAWRPVVEASRANGFEPF